MTKTEFVLEMTDRLSPVPFDELEERLAFYLEMIDDRMEEGLSEAESVSAAGSMDEIAAQILSEIPLSRLVKERIKPKRRLSVWEIVLLVLGSPIWLSLLISAVAVVLSLYISLWAVILSLWAVFVSAAAGSASGIVLGVWFSGGIHRLTGIALIGAGIFCAGLTVFLFFGCKAATKGTLRLTKTLLLRLKRCFVRKEDVR